MLLAPHDNEVSFTVDVHGTSLEPQVRLVLGRTVFQAVRGAGDRWTVGVPLGAEFAPGDYDMRVEVVLKDRLFVPLRRTVSVGASGEPAPCYTQIPDEVEAREDGMPPVPEIVATPRPVRDPPTDLGRSSDSPDLTALRRAAGRVGESVSRRAPAKRSAARRLRIAEIADDAACRFDAVLSESATYAPQAVTQVTVPISIGTPVRLVKGAVVME